VKSLVISGKLNMSVVAGDIPEPKDGLVRIKVKYVGICGSDLHYFFEGANGTFVLKEPLVPGHELSGVVDLDPSGEYSSGTRVTIHPARLGNSLPGIETLSHLWPNGSYLGSASTTPHTQGAMSEFLIVEKRMIRTIPESLSLKGAALCEPLAVALHAINLADGVTNKNVLISGSGPIGLLVIAACKVLGAASICATDVFDGPLARSKELGADRVIKIGEEAIPVEEFDLVLECSGVASALSDAIVAVRRAGTIVQVGVLPAGHQTIAVSPLISKEVRLLGCFRFNNEIDQAIRMISENPWIEKVITHSYSLDEAKVGFQMAKNSELSSKVLIAF